MKRLMAVTLLLSLAAAEARAAAPFANVPAGARVRVVSDLRHGTLAGTFAGAGRDSLTVALPGGERTVTLPVASVTSFTYLSDTRPSPRLAALAGIGLGAAGGALLAIAASSAGGEGGGVAPAGGEGGGDRAPFAPAAVTAASGGANSGASNAYWGVMGAVIGGIAGGVLGELTGLGLREAVWTSVPVHASASLAPAPAAPPIFAVRLAWPRGRAAR